MRTPAFAEGSWSPYVHGSTPAPNDLNVRTIPRENYAGHRQFMVVHALDGLVDVLHPEALAAVMRQLLTRVPHERADYFLGLDGGGIIPALTASLLTGKPLKVGYKADLALEHKVGFAEPQSPVPMIFAYNLPPGSRTVVFDDEIRTGDTLCNCVEALAKADITVVGVVVPIESVKYPARERLRERGHELVSYAVHDG